MSGHDFDRYIELYRKAVTDAALFIVKDPADADDIAQDVFLKLYTFGGTFTGDEHVKAWLLRCAVNAGINLVRSYRYRNSLPLDSIGEAADERMTGSVSLKDELLRLDPKIRAAIYMHYYEGYTVEETAKLLGISTAAVKWRLKRGRDTLRLIIEEERG